MKRILLSISFFLALAISGESLQAQQITRKQLGQKFYQATQYHNTGKDSLAIATLEEIIEVMPNFAQTYRREAEIYDDMSKAGNQLALNGAVIMYRKYLTLELDASKTADVQSRLRELENKLNVEHFEDSQRNLAREEEKQKVVLASLDDGDNDLDAFVMSVSNKTKTSISKRPSLRISKKEDAPAEEVKAVKEMKNAETKPVATNAAKGNAAPESPVKKQKVLSYVKFFNLNIPKKAIDTSAPKTMAVTNNELIGHWVSSETNPSGREYWIFDVTPFGASLTVTLSDVSGVINPDQEEGDLGDKIMKMLRTQNVIAHTTQMDINDRVTTGSINSNHFVFSIEGNKEYVPNTNIYNWTKQVLDNVTPIIPFGNIISKIGESVTNNLSKKDESAQYKIVMNFDCELESDGIMKVAMQKRTTRTAASGSKTSTELSSFVLYRTSGSYTHFSPEILDTNEADEQALMNEAKEYVEDDTKIAYALGLLYHNGIGEEKNDQEAVSYMTLATQTEMAPKAMAWLAKFYNEESENASSLSFFTRRKYNKMSGLWLDKMKENKMTEWYGVKADILSGSADKEKQDSALIYFQQGAVAGDPYCTYRFALLQSAKGSHTEAATKLLQAGQKGYADAYCDLAVIMRQGLTGPVDYNEYLKYLTLALENGSVKGLKELANAYLMGYGVPKDFVQGNVLRSYWYQSMQSQWLDDLYSLGLDIEQLK